MRRCTETGVWIPTLAETVQTLKAVLDGSETMAAGGTIRKSPTFRVGRAFRPGDSFIMFVTRWRRLSDDEGRHQILPVLECGEIVLTRDEK